MSLAHVVSMKSRSAGKYYFEVEMLQFDVPIYEISEVGITRDNPPLSYDQASNRGATLKGDGDCAIEGSGGDTQFGERSEALDVFGVAVDFNAANPNNVLVWFCKNGVWGNGGDPEAGTGSASEGLDLPSGTYFAAASAGEMDGFTHEFQPRLRARADQFLLGLPVGFLPWEGD
ncbi:MAG: hypothetical protein ABI605_10850 [Rhizobacter sp.]